MKTALEWFRTLPEEEGKRAIANTSSSKLERVYSSLSQAIFESFLWKNTPEGNDHWFSIYDANFQGVIEQTYSLEESRADLLDVAKQTLVMLNNQGMGNSVFAKQVKLAIEKAEKIK